MQGLLEGVDLADQGVKSEARQLEGRDTVLGQQQGVAAMLADIDAHDWAGCSLGDKLFGGGGQPERGEPVQGADACQGRGEVIGQPTPILRGTAGPGGDASVGRDGEGRGISVLAEPVTQLLELRGQVRMMLPQVGEVIPGGQGLTEQHCPARFQQSQRPLCLCRGCDTGFCDRQSRRVTGQPGEPGDRVLLIVAPEMARGHLAQKPYGHLQQVGRPVRLGART